MFDYTSVTGRFSMIRAHCAGLDSDELTDTTIDLPSYSAVNEAKVNTKFTDFSSMPVASQTLVGVRYTYLVAADLCESYCKGRSFRITDNKSQDELDKIDWDELAKILRGKADDVVSDIVDVVTIYPGLVLAPSCVNPVTLDTQSLIGG